MVLINVNRVVLHVAEIDGVYPYIANQLCGHFGAATRAACQANETENP